MSSKWPRRFCCDDDLAFIGYDGRDAERDLASWRRRGARRTTQELIDIVRAQGIEGSVVMDIGAGVGAVHVALLEAGAARAVDVDASREYQAAARSEAERRGLAGRVEYFYGDVVELADTLPPVDVVTMDSVICCYPYLPELLRAAVRSKPRLVGLTYPRDVWWMRAWMRLFNAKQVLWRSPARYFIHRQPAVNRLLTDAGYEQLYSGGSPGWRVILYRSAERGMVVRGPWPSRDQGSGTDDRLSSCYR